jgi:anti-sigma regulatory factor (Ser/Thr protein kinase)
MSSRVDVVHGSLPARDLEPGSDVGPALGPDEPVPYPWPSHDCLELGALPTAVACARLHARNLLWEWGVDWFASDAELVVSELVTNAVKVTAVRGEAAIRVRLSSDGTRVLIEVWDADPWPPITADRGEDGRPNPQERGLVLVGALSARWDWYLTKEPRGKVVWCEIAALSARDEPADQGDDRVDVAVDVELRVPRLLENQALEDGGTDPTSRLSPATSATAAPGGPSPQRRPRHER